jgi:hypothetical protein
VLVGGHVELDPETFGRVDPAQGAQLAVGPVLQRTQPEFAQAELEEDGRYDRHQAERLRSGRAAGCVCPVEGAGGSDQAPDGKPGGQARLGSRGAAREQHGADAGRAVEREEE